MKKLIELIESYKDFPNKGIEFKDVLGITQEPKIFKELILKMASSEIIKNAEAIISIDARGFIFGSAISFQASKPMIVAIKPWKLLEELLKKIIISSMVKIRFTFKKKPFKNITLMPLLMIY